MDVWRVMAVVPLQKIPSGDPTTTMYAHHLLRTVSLFQCMMLLLTIVYMICVLLA